MLLAFVFYVSLQKRSSIGSVRAKSILPDQFTPALSPSRETLSAIINYMKKKLSIFVIFFISNLIFAQLGKSINETLKTNKNFNSKVLMDNGDYMYHFSSNINAGEKNCDEIVTYYVGQNDICYMETYTSCSLAANTYAKQLNKIVVNIGNNQWKDYGNNSIYTMKFYDNVVVIEHHYDNNKNYSNSTHKILKPSEHFELEIEEYLKNELEGAKIYNQVDFIKDVNGDGVKDYIIYMVYGYGGTAIGGIEVFFYVNKGNQYNLEFIFKPDYRFSIDKIENGIIYCTKYKYKDSDPNCCPSIKIPFKLKYENGFVSYYTQ